MTVFKPKGVCSKEMRIELDGEKIKSVEVLGGCNGNLKGISALVTGMNVKDAIEKLRGTSCANKQTSCPDQMSYALEQALTESQGEQGQQE